LRRVSAGTEAGHRVRLIHQTNFLLDRQKRQLEQAFVEEVGFSERLYRMRSAWRK